MNTLILDIETGPNLPLLNKVVPPNPFPEFDPDDVKLGNTKNPELVAAKLAQKAEDHEANRDGWDEQDLSKRMSDTRCTLTPCMSLVVCAGMKEDGDDAYSIMNPTMTFGGEANILLELAERMGEADFIVGWNVKGFDLPYLAFRWRVHGITPPVIAVPEGRYYGNRVVDLMEVCGEHQYGNRYKLKHVAPAFGFPPCPEDSGKFFWKLLPGEMDRAKEYQQWDVDAVHHILTAYPELCQPFKYSE